MAIKDIINKKIQVNELNLKLFNIVREHVKNYEDKSYTRRYLKHLDAKISKVFGSDIFKYGGSSLDTELSWRSIKLDLSLNNDYSYSYQLYYDSQYTFTLETFDLLNKCWSLDKNRNEKLRNLLKDNKVINQLAKNIIAINNASESFDELFEYDTDANEIQYDLRDLLNVKLESK